MKYQQSKGFTLVEVLIAAVILFSALAITAELFSTSSLLANKVSEKALVYQVTPVAISSIKAEIHRRAENRQLAEFTGELHIAGVLFSWQANREKFAARPLELDDIVPPQPQFGLFNVNVMTKSEEKKSSEFMFKVATW